MTGESATPPPANNGSVEREFGWWRTFLCTTAPASAAAILGGTVGLLTGVSGHDANVLAATLPAVLSAAGAVAYVVVTRRDDDNKRLACAVSGLVVLFSIAFLAGSYCGAYIQKASEAIESEKAEKAQKKAQIEARAVARGRRIDDLRDCSILQFQINHQRKALDLPPLTISQACPFIDVSRVAPIPIPKETSGVSGGRLP